MRSLERRVLAAILIALTAGLALVGLAAVLIVSGHIEQGFDARLRSVATTLAAGADFTADGEFVATAEPAADEYRRIGSGWYWMIASRDRVLSRSRSLWTNALPTAPEAGEAAHPLVGPRGEPLRAVRIETGAGRPRTAVTVTVAGPARALSADILAMTMRLAALLVAGALLTLLLAAFALRRALVPLSRAAADVGRLGAGRLSALPPTRYREIDALIGAVNLLLDEARNTVSRSRLLAANLAHALKTPLAALRARLALVAPDDRTIAEDVARLDRQIERHLGQVRHLVSAPFLPEPVALRSVLEDVRLVVARSRPGRSVAITLEAPSDLLVSVDREALEEVFGALVDNAATWARTGVAIVALAGPDATRVTITDDGPGLPPEERIALVEAGRRLDESRPGQGLGLAVATEVLGAVGGSLSLDASAAGGLVAEVRLPHRRAPAAPGLPTAPDAGRRHGNEGANGRDA